MPTVQLRKDYICIKKHYFAQAVKINLLCQLQVRSQFIFENIILKDQKNTF